MPLFHLLCILTTGEATRSADKSGPNSDEFFQFVISLRQLFWHWWTSSGCTIVATGKQITVALRTLFHCMIGFLPVCSCDLFHSGMLKWCCVSPEKAWKACLNKLNSRPGFQVLETSPTCRAGISCILGWPTLLSLIICPK